MGGRSNLQYPAPKVKVKSCDEGTNEWSDRIQRLGSFWCRYSSFSSNDSCSVAALGHDKWHAAGGAYSYDFRDNRLYSS